MFIYKNVQVLKCPSTKMTRGKYGQINKWSIEKSGSYLYLSQSSYHSKCKVKFTTSIPFDFPRLSYINVNFVFVFYLNRTIYTM